MPLLGDYHLAHGGREKMEIRKKKMKSQILDAREYSLETQATMRKLYTGKRLAILLKSEILRLQKQNTRYRELYERCISRRNRIESKMRALNVKLGKKIQ